MTYKIAQRIDKDLNVTLMDNPEIRQRWFPLVIGLDYQDAFPTIKAFVQSVGRQKYILPIYTALVKNGYRSQAYQWYNERKTFYHPIAAANIRKIIFSSRMEIYAYEEQIEEAGDNIENLFLQ
jgi:leukotriene-A4 hydrolase